MKHILLFSMAFMCCQLVHTQLITNPHASQLEKVLIGRDMTFMAFAEDLKSKLSYFENDNTTELANVKGSVYWNEEFLPGTLVVNKDGAYVNVYMRYRILDDKFQIKPEKKEKETMTLNRSGEYDFFVNNKWFTFLRELPIAIKGAYNGYAIVLVDGTGKAAWLYKRLSQEIEEKQGTANPLGYQSPAKLITNQSYFLKVDGNLYLIEPHKKRVANAFPDNNKLLEKFIDENNLKFRKDEDETDLIKLVTYYNSLKEQS